MALTDRDKPAGTTRRDLVKTALAAGVVAATPALAGKRPNLPSSELDEITVADLQQAMRDGRYTSVSLVAAYQDRIEDVDPLLHSVIELNPEAKAIATELDSERAAGRVRGPLHGIPVLVKDNIATHDRMETTAGSLALVGAKPKKDAFIIQQLRAAGAVILGKANLSEWANMRSTNSSSGWSARGGQCRNPYALDRSPCGSSSGSGAAVSANLVPLAVGTETDGSVVCPSAINGLVGIKPTLGLVSRSGIIPIAHSQDTAGPMARTVADAAILLGALTGADPSDSATADALGHTAVDYRAAANPGGLHGFRLGVPRGLFGYSPDSDRIAESAIQVLAGLGATIVDPAEIPHLEDYGDAEYEVLLYELKTDMALYLKGVEGQGAPRTLADLISFNQAHAAEEMPYFGQEIFEKAETKGPLTDPAYLEALATCRRLARDEGLDAVLKQHRLDALVAPTNSPAWPIDLINGDHYLGSCSSPAAVSGYPHITVPGGFAHGLPVGLSFFGRAFSEPALIRMAAAFEAATQHRRAPTMPATLSLP